MAIAIRPGPYWPLFSWSEGHARSSVGAGIVRAQNATAIAAASSSSARGSGRKTGSLLAGLDDPVDYTPIGISCAALLASVARLERRFARIKMLPVCADFTRAVALPRPGRRADRRLVYFPGSTLGNFDHEEAVRLLQAMRDTVGDDGLALVGIDLDKDPEGRCPLLYRKRPFW